MARTPLRKSWTAEEDALLKRMLEAGKSHSVIAIRLKRSIKTINVRARRLEAAGKPPDQHRTIPDDPGPGA